MWDDEAFEDGFDTAQVCRNGHMIAISVERYGEYAQKHCQECGAATTTVCDYCNVAIQGLKKSTSIMGGGSGRNQQPPSFCHNCGKPYPWTETAIAKAREMTEMVDGLPEDERARLNEGLDDLVAGTPGTAVAVARWKIFLQKAGPVITNCFKQVMYPVMSEAVRRQFWPSS